MLTRILSYFQVDPGYLDFLFAFGSQIDPLDQAFSGFRGRNPLEIASNYEQNDLIRIGRSRERLQSCYNLKTVATESASDADIREIRWSIRHLAVHHEYDFKTGKTLWILTRGGTDVQPRIEDLTSPNGRQRKHGSHFVDDSFRLTLDLHLLFVHWAAENWRWHIRWAEQLFESTVCICESKSVSHRLLSFLLSNFLYLAHANCDSKTTKVLNTQWDKHDTRQKCTVELLQHVQWQQDKISETINALRCNSSILTSLRTFYHNLIKSGRVNEPDSFNRMTIFLSEVEIVNNDMGMQRLRATLLEQMIRDRKGVVGHYKTICDTATAR